MVARELEQRTNFTQSKRDLLMMLSSYANEHESSSQNPSQNPSSDISSSTSHKNSTSSETEGSDDNDT